MWPAIPPKPIGRHRQSFEMHGIVSRYQKYRGIVMQIAILLDTVILNSWQGSQLTLPRDNKSIWSFCKPCQNFWMSQIGSPKYIYHSAYDRNPKYRSSYDNLMLCLLAYILVLWVSVVGLVLVSTKLSHFFVHNLLFILNKAKTVYSSYCMG